MTNNKNRLLAARVLLTCTSIIVKRAIEQIPSATKEPCVPGIALDPFISAAKAGVASLKQAVEILEGNDGGDAHG